MNDANTSTNTNGILITLISNWYDEAYDRFTVNCGRIHFVLVEVVAQNRFTFAININIVQALSAFVPMGSLIEIFRLDTKILINSL